MSQFMFSKTEARSFSTKGKKRVPFLLAGSFFGIFTFPQTHVIVGLNAEARAFSPVISRSARDLWQKQVKPNVRTEVTV